MKSKRSSPSAGGELGGVLGTRDGTTYAVKQISGVAQRIDLPGDHPLVGRFVPDRWLAGGSRLVDHVTTAGSCCSTARPTGRSPAVPPPGRDG